MHKKLPKICTGCRVSAAKIYLYHSIEIAKARPHSKEWQTDTSVQKQWSMISVTWDMDDPKEEVTITYVISSPTFVRQVSII